MRRFALHFTIVLAFAVSCWAQQQAAPAQDSQKHSHGKGAHPITGCLSGPNDEGAYVLTSGTHKFEVGGNDELKKHVGHKVQLSGTWSTGAEIGEKEKAEKNAKSEKAERHLKVDSIKMVSETCQPASSASHGKKAKKSAPAKPTT